jgi:hypothetical protein
LEFVSISRSSLEVHSSVSDTIVRSFSGSSWTQLIVKKFAQSELMLIHQQTLENAVEAIVTIEGCR